MVCLCRAGAISPACLSSVRGHLTYSGGCASIVLNELKYWESVAVTVIHATNQIVQNHALKIYIPIVERLEAFATDLTKLTKQ